MAPPLATRKGPPPHRSERPGKPGALLYAPELTPRHGPQNDQANAATPPSDSPGHPSERPGKPGALLYARELTPRHGPHTGQANGATPPSDSPGHRSERPGKPGALLYLHGAIPLRPPEHPAGGRRPGGRLHRFRGRGGSAARAARPPPSRLQAHDQAAPRPELLRHPSNRPRHAEPCGLPRADVAV